MNYKEAQNTIKSIVNKTFDSNLMQHLIVKKGNSFHIYDRFIMVSQDESWIVTSKRIDMTLEFHSAKSALAWCLAYMVQNYELANQLHLLDHRLIQKQMDINFLIHRLKTKIPLDDMEIVQHKLTEDIARRQNFKRQLEKCVQTAKYIKIKGSSNYELNRFNKTNRLN